MRTAVNNPFTPGSDVLPEVWAGRVRQLSDWEDIVRPRLAAGLFERGRVILGEPGLGKSTLVRRIAESAERRGDWVTSQLRIPSGTDPLKAVADAILKLADQAGLGTARDRRIKSLLERVRTVAISGIALTVDRSQGAEPHTALTDLLTEIGLAAIDAETVALIHVDEIQNITDEHALSQLLIAFGDTITKSTTVTVPGNLQMERSLPIAVYLTGLPEFMERASSKSGATFARRFATETLTPLSDADLMVALHTFIVSGWEIADGAGSTAKIHMTPEAAEKIIWLAHGEPFLFQLAGERAWYAGSGALITRTEVTDGWEGVKHEAMAHVERILDRLPQKEREFVEVMAALPATERQATRIAKIMGYRTAANVGPIAQRLDTMRGIISRGTAYTFRHRAVEAYLTSDWPHPGR